MLQCNRPLEDHPRTVKRVGPKGEAKDMTKAKTAEKTIASAESAFFNGAEAIKTGFEKAVKSYDTVLSYGKDTVEAYMKSATVAGKGIETINSEIYSFSKDAIEESIAASKAILGSKSVHEAFELQTDYAKSAFDSYVSELTKVSELVNSAAKDSFAPLQGRVQAWVEVVQSARAA
jgi:phasin family protein